MINGIDIALRRVESKIPRNILETVFKADTLVAIFYKIKNEVFYKFVIPDCNLLGGKVIPIELQQSWAVPLPGEPFSLYEIPADVRENRNIIEVHKVTRKISKQAGYGTAGYAFPYGPSTSGECSVSDQAPAMIYASNKMLNSKTGFGTIPQDPIPELMGNSVKLHPNPGIFIPWFLTCRLSYDNEMRNLNSAAVSDFADLCLLGVKQYCYTNLVTQLDSGEIEFGAELGSIKDIIQEWSNLDDIYAEKKERFCASSIMDIRRFQGLIESMV